jgi:hypothetical protein
VTIDPPTASNQSFRCCFISSNKLTEYVMIEAVRDISRPDGNAEADDRKEVETDDGRCKKEGVPSL